MRATCVVIAAIGVVLATTSEAQTRRPEHERLSAMVGSWQTELEVAATPATPATKVNGTEECAWFADLHVICRSDAKTQTGPYSAIRIVSYQSAIKQYAIYTVDSTGLSLLAFGDISGDKWTFTAEGQGAKSRLILTIGATGYTGVSEFSRDGSWTPVSIIKATRVTP
jgi:hypothetical protein